MVHTKGSEQEIYGVKRGNGGRKGKKESSEEYVLNTCAACSDLKARDLKSNAELDNEIKFLFFLELVRRSNNDVENAKALFLSY